MAAKKAYKGTELRMDDEVEFVIKARVDFVDEDEVQLSDDEGNEYYHDINQTTYTMSKRGPVYVDKGIYKAVDGGIWMWKENSWTCLSRGSQGYETRPPQPVVKMVEEKK